MMVVCCLRYEESSTSSNVSFSQLVSQKLLHPDKNKSCEVSFQHTNTRTKSEIVEDLEILANCGTLTMPIPANLHRSFLRDLPTRVVKHTSGETRIEKMRLAKVSQLSRLAR
jgi:hypothetical protein